MTAGLRPPAGAEPGTVWELRRYDDAQLWCWSGDTWERGHMGRTPESMAEFGYRLADPHGLLPAHHLMEEAGYQIGLVQGASKRMWRCGVRLDGAEIAVGYGDSALAAAQDAVRAMREGG